MLSEESVRTHTSTAVCLILALAGVYSIALQLRQRGSKASRAHPDKVKFRFTERMWNWITQVCYCAQIQWILTVRKIFGAVNAAEKASIACSKGHVDAVLMQDPASDVPSMLHELGSPDRNGVHSCSSIDGHSLYIRQAQQQQSGFEWSIEKLVWHPTSQVIGSDTVLCEEHQVIDIYTNVQNVPCMPHLSTGLA